MTNYALTTWSPAGLAGYEPLIASSQEAATAFAHGLLTERTRQNAVALADLGVRYDIEQGHRELHEIMSDHVSVVLGSWIIDMTTTDAPLVWAASAEPVTVA